MEKNTSKYISNREEDEFRTLICIIDYDDEDGMLEENNNDNEIISTELATIL